MAAQWKPQGRNPFCANRVLQGVPKEGIIKNLSDKMVNKKEYYVHFASILYVTCGVIAAWAAILYMRINDVGSWWGPLLVHFYFMGAFFIVGVNDLHYVAHHQVSNNQKNHVFKSELRISMLSGCLPAGCHLRSCISQHRRVDRSATSS